MDDIIIPMDLFLVDLVGSNVLGMHWLESLELVSIDFKNHTMYFNWDGRRICWNGEN